MSALPPKADIVETIAMSALSGLRLERVSCEMNEIAQLLRARFSGGPTTRVDWVFFQH
jgi:hypothetical protein